MEVVSGHRFLLRVGQGGSSTSSFRLMELLPEVLDEICAPDGTVCIKGGGAGTEPAVLCTRTATYSVKLAETTNTMLLTPPVIDQLSDAYVDNHNAGCVSGGAPSSQGLTVVGMPCAHWELQRIAPRLAPLESLLRERPFRGFEFEEQPEFSQDTQLSEQLPRGTAAGRLYSLTDLTAVLQASEREVLKALAELSATEINGRWRLFDPLFEAAVAKLIFSEAASRGLSCLTDGISALELITSLPDIPECAVRHMLRILGEPQVAAGDGAPEGNADRWVLQTDSVCRFYGESLLRKQARWNIGVFLNEWRAAVPEEYTVDATFCQLRGIAIVKLVDAEELVCYVPKCQLSAEIGERIKELFSHRDVWVFEDIEPYIRDLVPPHMTKEQVMLKYARASKHPGSGTTIYTARTL